MPPDLSDSIQSALLAGHSPSDVVNYLQANPTLLPQGSNIAGARAAGYSDQDIVNHLNPPPATAGVLGALDHLVPPSVDRGIAQAASGLADTADIAGASGLAAGIRSHIDPKALNAPTSFHALSSDLSAGHYGSALTDIPGAVGEALPQLAGTLVSGVAGSALGTAIGPEGTAAGFVGGVAAPALLSVAQQAGSIAKARAAADGRATPNDADIATAVGSSAVLGLLDKVGLGDAAGGLLTRAVKTVIAHGASSAVQNAGQQLAATAGTAQGATVDPSQVAAAGVQGAGVRAAMGGAQSLVGIAQSRTPAARQAALADQWNSLSPEDQQNQINTAAAAKAVADTQASATSNPVDPQSPQAARTAAVDISNNLRDLKNSLVGQNVLDDNGAQKLQDIIGTAKNSQRVLTDDHMQDLQELGLDQNTTDLIANSVQQLNMLSDAGVAKRGTSTLGKLGGTLGAVAGFPLSAWTGHPFVGAEAGAAGGRALGNFVAQKLGLMQSPLVKAAGPAVDMMTAAGVPVPDTKAQLTSAVGQQRDALDAMDAQLGLKASTEQQQALVAKQRAAAQGEMQQQNAADVAKQSQVDAAYSQADQQRQAQLNAAFQNMEGQQRIAAQTQKLNDVRTAALTRSQVAGFMADQAARNSAAQQQDTAGLQAAQQSQTQFNQGQSATDAVTALADRAGNLADRIQARGQPPVPPGAPMAQAIARVAAARPQAPPAAPTPTPMPVNANAAPTASEGPNTMGMENMPPSMASYAQRLAPWKYGLGRSVEESLSLAGKPQALDYGAEANSAVQEALQRGWLDGGAIPGDQRAAALIAHNGRFSGQVYNALRNLMLEKYGITRRDPSVIAADPQVQQAAE